MKKLPIGISTLRQIIEEGYTYVDKSRFVHDLVKSGKYYFLSRPRRFGKSLFIDTLKEAFEGNHDLFLGLWIHDHWDWTKKYPVIHISLAGGVIRNRQELDYRIEDILYTNQADLQVTCREPADIAGCFGELIKKAAQTHGHRTVILIDEYDKPIIDNITDPAAAAEIREGLKNLYSVIKDHDAWVQFAFLTGVSKFSKVSLFSGLNNLRDITLNAAYGAICGYTEGEMRAVFAEHLQGRNSDDIRKWYNGYSWLGEKVYNPLSVLNYLEDGTFRNYWFETGTPEFLMKLVKERKYLIPSLERIKVNETILGSFDTDFIELETLLFQTGYLTIQSMRQIGASRIYDLCFPNLEVKSSLTDFILHYLSRLVVQKENNKIALYEYLQSNDLDSLRSLFHAFFSSIPHDWYRKNKLAGYEGYYASIFYCYFTALGLDVTAEDTTNHGRIDMTVKLDSRVYIFEFKVIDIDPSPGRALEQIKQKGYADKYRARFAEVYLVGVEFDRVARNIARFEWTQA